MRIATPKTLIVGIAVAVLPATVPSGPSTPPVTRGHAVEARASRPALTDPVLRRLRTEMSVEVDVASRVARYEVQEEFRNDDRRVREADWVHPVPRGGILTGLALFAGEERLVGEVLEAQEARRIYEEIVRRRRDPALVELAGADLIRARVFPIEAGQTRKMVLRYLQPLRSDDDLIRLRIPLATGLMTTAPEPGDRPAERVAPAPGPATVTLRLRLRDASRLGTPLSPTHRIEVVRRSDDVAEVIVQDAARGGDFELLLPLAGDDVGLRVVAHSPAPDSEEGYFLLLVTPPAMARSEPIPRDVTLVLDVSGSMSGRKLEQARRALIQFLEGLEERDRFRLITFSTVVRSFRPEPLQATADHVAAAVQHLRSVEADGSTNVHDALAAALEPAAAPGRLSLVVFLTDGKPTVSVQDPVRIAAAAERWRDGERVFAFGVGADVNTFLLERMAEGGRGASSYVRPDEDVEAAVSALARKLGAPVLADLRLAATPVPLEELYPSPPPDLFRGEELALLGRYRDGGGGELILEGTGHDGPLRLRRRVELPDREPGNAFVARLWAARKAGALTTRLRLHGPDPETVDALRTLGLRYGILTEYTSYLVQEPGIPVGRERTLIEESIEAAAAPPAAQTGDQAFQRARASSRLKQAASMAEADAALEGLAGPPGSGAADGRPPWQRVDRRLFVSRDGTWTDVAARPDAPEMAVAPYGDAWFRLLERLPGLRRAAGLGERVKIAGDGLVLHLTPDGRERLGTSDWRRLLAAFATDAG